MVMESSDEESGDDDYLATSRTNRRIAELAAKRDSKAKPVPQAEPLPPSGGGGMVDEYGVVQPSSPTTRRRLIIMREMSESLRRSEWYPAFPLSASLTSVRSHFGTGKVIRRENVSPEFDWPAVSTCQTSAVHPHVDPSLAGLIDEPCAIPRASGASRASPLRPISCYRRSGRFSPKWQWPFRATHSQSAARTQWTFTFALLSFTRQSGRAIAATGATQRPRRVPPTSDSRWREHADQPHAKFRESHHEQRGELGLGVSQPHLAQRRDFRGAGDGEEVDRG